MKTASHQDVPGPSKDDCVYRKEVEWRCSCRAANADLLKKMLLFVKI